MATVTIRYWAGVKAAAGVADEQVVASTLDELLRQVRRNRDERFRHVIDVCSFVVSEQPVGATPAAQVRLADGDVVDVLPPFAGGADPA